MLEVHFRIFSYIIFDLWLKHSGSSKASLLEDRKKHFKYNQIYVFTQQSLHLNEL